jgi:hypothetical protein
LAGDAGLSRLPPARLDEDLDDPGHLFVVSEWERREAADKVLADYASSPNARLANELVSEPRPTPSGVAWERRSGAQGAIDSNAHGRSEAT